MKKRRKTVKKRRIKERFCVIQPTLRNDSRLFFSDDKKAAKHAADMIEGRGPFPNYRPRELLVVKVVKTIKVKASAGVLDDDSIHLVDDEQ